MPVLTDRKNHDTMWMLKDTRRGRRFLSPQKPSRTIEIKRLPSSGQTPLPCLSAATAMMGGVVMSKRIALTQGECALVDDADYEWLNQHKWHYLSGRYTGYAARHISIAGKSRQRVTLMHRLILNTPPGMDTDHVNGDGCDNRRCNLRISTRSQNIANGGKYKCESATSRYRGVCWHRATRKWRAQIKVKGKMIHIGLFTDEQKAAAAYNTAALKYFREFAKPNVIQKEEHGVAMARREHRR